MNQEPLISTEMFDYLRKLGIEPYTKLNNAAREQLGDGVRLVVLFAGERFVTQKPGLRITTLSGTVRLEPANILLDLAASRERTILTQAGDNHLTAIEDAVVVVADAEFLDMLSSWTELAAYARHAEGEDMVKRLMSIRHTLAFQRLPLEHVIAALKLMNPRQVKAGEVIVNQGERGDAFYLIWSGRAEIWKADIYDDEAQLVATIGPKDTFGDEALVVGGNRNASVKMIEDGELLVLGELDFRNLMSQPASLRKPQRAETLRAASCTSVTQSICRAPSAPTPTDRLPPRRLRRGSVRRCSRRRVPLLRHPARSRARCTRRCPPAGFDVVPGVGGVGRQPGALGVVARRGGAGFAQHQLADGGDVQRRAAADELLDAHHAVRRDAFDIDHLVALAHGQVHRFADLVAQPFHFRPRHRAHIQADPDFRRQLQQMRPKQVEAGFIAGDETMLDQRSQDAKRSGWMQAGFRRENLQRSAVLFAARASSKLAMRSMTCMGERRLRSQASCFTL
jgi:CRP-like cAMP-binding protein